MDTVGGAFSYRVSTLDGTARLDVRGRVTADQVGPVLDAIDRLVTTRPEGLVLGLAQADVDPALRALLRRYAEERFPADRVLVDAAPHRAVNAYA